MTTPAPDMPDWTLMVWMLDAYAEKCTGQQRRDEAIEQAAALRNWLAAQPAAGAVVVDEAAVSRLADFIEDRPAYICLPDDERKRMAREYLTAAIGGA